jgi:hypothetical protein
VGAVELVEGLILGAWAGFVVGVIYGRGILPALMRRGLRTVAIALPTAAGAAALLVSALPR